MNISDGFLLLCEVPLKNERVTSNIHLKSQFIKVGFMLQVFDGIFKIGYMLQVFDRIFFKGMWAKNM